MNIIMDLRRVFGNLLFFLLVLTMATDIKIFKGTAGCLETILRFGFTYVACNFTEEDFNTWFTEPTEIPCKDQCTLEVDLDKCENKRGTKGHERKKRAHENRKDWRMPFFDQGQFEDVFIKVECASKNLNDYFGYICSTHSECKKPNTKCSKTGEIGTGVCKDGFIRVHGSCKKESICKFSETSTSSYDEYSTNNNRKKEYTTIEPQIGTSGMPSEHHDYGELHVSEETHNITILVVGVGIGSFILGVLLSLGIVFIVRKRRIQENQNNNLKNSADNPTYNKYIEGSESNRRGNIPDKVSTMPVADKNTSYSEVKILSDNKGDIYNHLHEQVTTDTAGLDSDYDHAKPLKEQLSPDREYSHLTSKIDLEDFKSNQDVQQSAEIEENADENAKPLEEQLSPDREYSHRTSKIDSENFKSNQDVQQSADIEENADENNDNYFTLEKIN